MVAGLTFRGCPRKASRRAEAGHGLGDRQPGRLGVRAGGHGRELPDPVGRALAAKMGSSPETAHRHCREPALAAGCQEFGALALALDMPGATRNDRGNWPILSGGRLAKLWHIVFGDSCGDANRFRLLDLRGTKPDRTTPRRLSRPARPTSAQPHEGAARARRRGFGPKRVAEENPRRPGVGPSRLRPPAGALRGTEPSSSTENRVQAARLFLHCRSSAWHVDPLYLPSVAPQWRLWLNIYKATYRTHVVCR